MKILFVCHEPLPSASTSTEQLVKAATAMSSLGPEVTVTAPVDRPEAPTELEARVADFYGLDAAAFGDALRLAPLPTPRFLRGSVRRPYHDLQAAALARRGDFDLVYVRDPIPLVAALRTGKPVAFETYRYDLNQGALYAPWRALCYGHPRLVGVVTHSELSRRSFLGVGFDPDEVLVAHNGYDPPPGGHPDRASARQRLDLTAEGPLVVYAGGVSESKGLGSLVPVAEALPEVRFLVVGHEPGSSGARWFEGRLSASRLTNVVMRPRVPPAEVGVHLAAADCLLIPTVSAPLERSGRTVLPMKTFRYLGAGRPIVAPDLEDIGEILRDGDNARLVPPDRPEATVAALREVLDDPAFSERLAEGALETVRNMSWSARARRIHDFLQRRNSPVSGGV